MTMLDIGSNGPWGLKVTPALTPIGSLHDVGLYGVYLTCNNVS